MLRRLVCSAWMIFLPWSAHAQEKSWPGRYQSPPKTRGVTVLELWGSPEQQPAYGHTAVFSKDGKQALYAYGGAIDPDGATDDSFLSLWDVAASRLVREIVVPKMAVTALALSPDDRFAYAGLLHVDGKGKESFRLTLWDLASGKAVKSHDSQTGAVTALAFAPDGKSALAVYANGLAQLYEGDKVKGVAKDKEPALAAAFHPDGTQALISFGSNLKLWDLQTGKEIREFKGHEGTVLAVAFSPDGKRAASSADDVSVRLWEVASGGQIGVLKKDAANNSLISIAFADRGKKVLCVWTGFDIATGTQEQSDICLWDPEAKKELWSHKARMRGVVPIFVAPDAKLATLGGGANPFTLVDLADGRETKLWGGHKSAVNALAALGNGTVLSAGQDATLKIWEHGIPVKTWRGHADAVNALALSKDGQFLITGSADKTVKLWDMRSGKVRKTFSGHTGNVTGVAFSPDFRWIVSGSNDRTLKVWDLVTAKELQTLTGHAEGVNCIALAPDASWVASASDDNTVRLWPLKDGLLDREREAVVLEGHQRQVTCVVFSADGKRLLTGSQDKTLKVWDVAKGTVAKTLEGHKNWISSVSYLGDHVVCSTSDDLTVRLWDVAKGTEVGQIDLSHSADCPRSLARLDNGDFVVGTSGWVILKCARTK
jgi:WD40 repeat protein